MTSRRQRKNESSVAVKLPADARRVRLVVGNKFGLHMRAASMLVSLAECFDASLVIECGKQRVNGKSIMSLLTLGASRCTPLNAITAGTDADRLLLAVKNLFDRRFYELPPRETPKPDHPHPAAHARHASPDKAIIREILELAAAQPLNV